MPTRGPYNIRRVSAADLEQTRNYLRFTADALRNRGNTMERAVHLVAAYYGLRIARVRKLISGHTVRVVDEQMAEIEARFREHLHEEWQVLEARAALLREQQHRMQAGKPVRFADEPPAPDQVKTRRRRTKIVTTITGCLAPGCNV